MKLYYSETLNPRKACAVARYLNSPVEFIHINLAKGEHQTPAYRSLNPNAKVPLLVDGEKRLWEANAIMCYLADKAGSDIWPKDDRLIEVMRWLSWDMQHFTKHAGMLYFQYLIKPHLGMGDPDAAAVEEAAGFFKRFAAILDDHLSGRDYLVGDRLSVADFATAITLPYAEDAHLPLEDFPHIRKWRARLNELDAWRNPFPKPAAIAA